MDASKFLEAIKLSPKYLLPIVIVSGFLLFAKPEILDIFGLAKLSTAYRPYIGGVLLLSAALAVSNGLVSLYKWYVKRRVWSKRIKSAKKRLHNLTYAEREILRRYIGGNTRTQYFQLENGVASGLALEHIIFRSSNVGNLDDGWAFNIQPWAWKYLNERRDLLFTKEELESGQWREVPDNGLSRRGW
jgi:hypothetical protein